MWAVDRRRGWRCWRTPGSSAGWTPLRRWSRQSPARDLGNVVRVRSGLEGRHGVDCVQQDVADMPSPLEEGLESLLVLLLLDGLDPLRELVDHEVRMGPE